MRRCVCQKKLKGKAKYGPETATSLPHPDTLVTLGNLAYAYGKTGDYRKEAELRSRH